MPGLAGVGWQTEMSSAWSALLSLEVASVPQPGYLRSWAEVIPGDVVIKAGRGEVCEDSVGLGKQLGARAMAVLGPSRWSRADCPAVQLWPC